MWYRVLVNLTLPDNTICYAGTISKLETIKPGTLARLLERGSVAPVQGPPAALLGIEGYEMVVDILDRDDAPANLKRRALEILGG